MSAPIYGCAGCAGTAGRMGCPEHRVTILTSQGGIPYNAAALNAKDEEIAGLQAALAHEARRCLEFHGFRRCDTACNCFTVADADLIAAALNRPLSNRVRPS